MLFVGQDPWKFPFSHLCMHMCVLDIQSCPTLCDPMDCGPPGFSVHGILQERILEWVLILFSRGSSRPRSLNRVCYIAADSLLFESLGKPREEMKRYQLNSKAWPVAFAVMLRMVIKDKWVTKGKWSIYLKSEYEVQEAARNQVGAGAQSCLTPWNLQGCRPPGSSVHGIFQARILEWAAISISGWSSWSRDQTHISCNSCLAGWFFTIVPPG